MNGDWTMRTSDGSITLRVPDDFSAFLDAWTSDGHIDLQLPVEISGRVEEEARSRQAPRRRADAADPHLGWQHHVAGAVDGFIFRAAASLRGLAF